LPVGRLPPEEGLSADDLPVYGLPDCDFSTFISTHPIDKYETPLSLIHVQGMLNLDMPSFF
jgi:hypothetical protein